MNPQLDLMLNQAIQSFQSGDLDRAQTILNRLLLVQPKNLPALHILGLIKASLSKHTEAAELLKRAARINPQDPSLQYNLAKALFESGAATQSLPHHKKAVALSPGNPEAWLNYGKSLSQLNRHDEALAMYDRALNLNSAYPEALINRGASLKELKRYEEALASADLALSINSGLAEAWSNKAAALKELQQLDEALLCYDKAIKINPNWQDTWFNKGVAFSALKQYENALACYNKAISIKPDYYEAWSNKGIALSELKRYEDGVASFNEAIELKPDFDYLLGNLIQGKLMTGMWGQLNEQIDSLIKKIEANQKAISPFAFLAISDSPKLHLQAAKIWANDKNPSQTSRLPPNKKVAQKIRLGYFSADFGDHPVSHLMAEIFELHDRSCFEIFAFSLRYSLNDQMQERLMNTFDHFINVESKTDQEIAELSRELEIDIAIDLGGYTQSTRSGIFSYHAAPIQVNYLGYPGTMGAEYFDYIIADPTIIPEDAHKFYSESIAYLPNSYMVDDSKRQASQNPITRAQFNLPEDRFIFCCFNNSYKFNRQMLSIWAKILLQVNNSVLWITENNTSFKQNILREFSELGIPADRIIFASRVESMQDHLARYRLADLFLNTHPYNAHTTALDSLKNGLPVITLLGESFAARVTASLLNSVGLPELITRTDSEYSSLAIALASQPEVLNKLKSKLIKNLASSPLFDTPLFTNHLEAIYKKMYDCYESGKNPNHIYLEPNIASRSTAP